MTAPAKQPEAQDPTFFTGSSFAVTEIELSLQQLTDKVRSLKQGNTSGVAVQQKLAAEDISKIATQIKTMADVITRTTLAHINRRPRP